MEYRNITDLLSADFAEIGAGSDISETLEFMELETELNPSAGGLLEGEGSAGMPAWPHITDKCLALLSQSRDLWVSVFLACSLGNQKGPAGLCEGLRLIERILSELWNNVWPPLDADDDNDPYERINALSVLSPQQGSTFGVVDFIELLNSAKLSSSRQLGSFSLKDYRDSQTSSNTDGSAPTTALIEASFEDTPEDALAGVAESLTEIKTRLTAISGIFAARTDGRHSIGFSRLHSKVDELLRFIAQFCEAANVAPGQTQEPAGQEVAPGRQVNVKAVSGEISNTADAVRMLEKVKKYFLENEPSSPVPLLLDRAIKLTSLSFEEIMRDVCPDAVRQMDWLIKD